MKHLLFYLRCEYWNESHISFTVFDYSGANCGHVTIRTGDVENFVNYSWNGNINWNDKLPAELHGRIQGKIKENR